MHHRTAKTKAGAVHPAPVGPRTEAIVHEPIRIKELCAATGLSFVQLLKVLRTEHNIAANINMTLPAETAELGIPRAPFPAETADLGIPGAPFH